MRTNEKADRRGLWLLAAGSVIGVLLGVATAFHKSGSDASAPPDGVIALVNGKSIPEEEYTRAVSLLASDTRTEITDADRAYALNRLIEEELLIQRGIAIGLVDSDYAVRKAITQAMLASIVAESISAQPSEDALRAFYMENSSLFAHSAPAARGQGATERNVARPPVFEESREQVEEAYLRRLQDDALREYLEWLRSEAKIVILPSLLGGEGQGREYAR